MENRIPEKAQLLETLQKKGLNVPDFIYVPAKEFISGDSELSVYGSSEKDLHSESDGVQWEHFL